MTLDRRDFLRLTAAGLCAGAVPAPVSARDGHPAQYQAIAFDALAIFDPRPIAAVAASLFPQAGAALMNAWRIRQFEYQWLRALAGQYVDFLQTTRDSLRFAARQLQLDLTPAREQQLLAPWSALQVWPDAVAALRTLQDAGVRLALLSNMTPQMLTDGVQRAGLDDVFEAVISTDRIRSYKPDPRAYALGVQTLGLAKEQILFVAFAGWDAAGAKWFGYPTYWANRANAEPEVLGAAPDAVGGDLAALVRFVLPDAVNDEMAVRSMTPDDAPGGG